MLVKLSSEQIADNWAYIKEAATRSFPEGTVTQEISDNTLENLLLDDMQCWWLCRELENGDGYTIHLIVLTSPVFDNMTRKHILRVCAAFGLQIMSKDLWQETLSELVRYAQRKGYAGVDAFTDNPDIVRASKLFNVSTSTYILYRIGD